MIISFIKNYIKIFLFIPKYLKFLSFIKHNNKIRPFFGVNIFSTGGPYIRTRRLTKYFGNYLINPNIIYAQSYWTDREIMDSIEYSKKNNIPMIFNQNGWYYESWFKGDYKSRNKLICEAHKNSKLVLYQSKFCKKFSKILNNYYAKNHIILLNDVPNSPKNKINKLNKKNFFLINGIFDENSGHMLLPTVKAFCKLISKRKIASHNIKLIVSGIFKESAKRSKWFREYIYYFKLLKKKNFIEYRGSYDESNVNLILGDISYAIHLKYNDPCPNKIVENLKRGIVNIYSDSGGVREIVGNSGVSIKIKKNITKKLLEVNYNVLEKKILFAIRNKKKLYKKTILQSKKYNFNNYVKTHEKIFKTYIN